jgi:hypothetical protein
MMANAATGNNLLVAQSPRWTKGGSTSDRIIQILGH